MEQRKKSTADCQAVAWDTRLGISVACHSVASKIESRLGPLRNKPRKYDKEQTQEIVLVVVGAVDHEGKQNHKTLPWCPAVFLVKNSHQKLCSPGVLTSNKNRIEIKRTNVQICMSRIAMKQKRQTGNSIINVSLHVEKYLNPVRATYFRMALGPT